MNSLNPLNKRDVTNHLLSKGSVFVHLDPRVPCVKCPPWLSDQSQLVLQFGRNFPVPIPDLQIDDQAISGTLSFKRISYACYCPWEAIFCIVGDEGRGQIWFESMPDEVAAEVKRARDARDIPPLPPPPPPKAASAQVARTRSGRPLPAGWRVIK